MMTEGREVNPDQITHHVVHPALHQNYASDFRLRRVNDIAPTLTSPILVGIANSMHLFKRPMMPEEPETPKVKPEAVSTPIIEVASDRKRSSEDTSPSTSPRKKWATEEMVSPPPSATSLPKGTMEKDLLPRRYEVFASNYEWVQCVRGSLLGLEADDSPSRRQIECSSHFQL